MPKRPWLCALKLYWQYPLVASISWMQHVRLAIKGLMLNLMVYVCVCWFHLPYFNSWHIFVWVLFIIIVVLLCFILLCFLFCFFFFCFFFCIFVVFFLIYWSFCFQFSVGLFCFVFILCCCFFLFFSVLFHLLFFYAYNYINLLRGYLFSFSCYNNMISIYFIIIIIIIWCQYIT